MSQARAKLDAVQLPELNDTKAEADRLTAANERLKKEIAERSRAGDRIRLIIDTIPVMAWSVRPAGDRFPAMSFQARSAECTSVTSSRVRIRASAAGNTTARGKCPAAGQPSTCSH